MKLKKFAKLLSVRQLRDFIRSSAVTRRFAEAHSLVYFGSIDSDDESRLVKGITVSNTYHDSHYLVGTDYGRDIIFLQRSDTLRAPHLDKKELYTWSILTVDLASRTQLPHVYVEGRNRHGPGFYETLAIKKREFSVLPYGFLSDYDPAFADRFAVHLSAATSVEFPYILTPENAAIIAHHFSMFDFEWHDDVLYVYFLSSHPTLHQLEHMLKAGVWLAGELDRASVGGSRASEG